METGVSSVEDLGIEFVIKTDLPKVEEAFGEFMAQVKAACSVGTVAATAEQAKVEKLFPSIAKWVQGYGHIEIGDQEEFGFVVGPLEYGGRVYEDNNPALLRKLWRLLNTG